MRLEEIGNERVEIGELTDKLTEKEFTITVKKNNDDFSNGHIEYRLDLLDKEGTRSGNNIAGYMKFVPDLHFDNGYSMTALGVEEEHRGKSLSDALFETLFQYAEMQKKEFNSAREQRKPLTALVLQKYGFQPVGGKARDTIYCIGRYGNDKLMIAFENETKRKEFENSNLCDKSQQYETVPKPDKVKGIEKVIIRAPYALTQEHIQVKRRKACQERFDITLYRK